MDYFCDKCDNLLTYIPSADETVKECQSCHVSVKMKPEDTLRFQYSEFGKGVIDQNILENMEKNPTNKKLYRPCPKCNYNYARMFRTGNQTTYVKCIECKDLSLWREEDFEAPSGGKSLKSRK